MSRNRTCGKIPADVQDLGAGQRLAARDHEEGHPQAVRLPHDAPQARLAQLLGPFLPDGLGVAALAAQVAAVGDAEDRDRRHVQPLPGEARPAARGRELPEHGPAKNRAWAGRARLTRTNSEKKIRMPRFRTLV